MKILAIDPGSAESGLVWYDVGAQRVLAKMKCSNEMALEHIDRFEGEAVPNVDILVCEMAESFGAKVWSQVFTAVFWAGRFVERWEGPYELMGRRKVKMTITGSPKAKDGQIRQCLIDRWGGKEAAIGKKAAPGPLFGVSADCWQALALAVTYAETTAARNAATGQRMALR